MEVAATVKVSVFFSTIGPHPKHTGQSDMRGQGDGSSRVTLNPPLGLNGSLPRRYPAFRLEAASVVVVSSDPPRSSR